MDCLGNKLKEIIVSWSTKINKTEKRYIEIYIKNYDKHVELLKLKLKLNSKY